MSVYLEVSTNCDDELYDNGNGGNNVTSQQNLLSLQSITSVGTYTT